MADRIVAAYEEDERVSRLTYHPESGWWVEDWLFGRRPTSLVGVVDWLSDYLGRAEVQAPEVLCRALGDVAHTLRSVAQGLGLRVY